MTNLQFQSSAIDAGGCISNAWEMLKQNYGMFLGIGLLAMLLTGCIPCLNIFLAGPVMGGVYYVVLRNMRREPVDFGMMFKGFEKFVPLMVIGLIQAIPGIIFQVLRLTIDLGRLGLTGGGKGRNGDLQFFQSSSFPDFAISGGLAALLIILTLVFLVFSIIWGSAFFFAVPLAMEHDLAPIDAIKLSARAAMANIGGLIVFFIFAGLIGLVGVMAICFGFFFVSLPLIFIANAFAYRQVFPLIEQNLNFSPPPPNAYGSNFGSGM